MGIFTDISTIANSYIFFNEEYRTRTKEEMDVIPLEEAFTMWKTEGWYICSFIAPQTDEEPIIEALSGAFSMKKKIKDLDAMENRIYVYGGEESIPHIHIVKKGEHDACIMLMENRYFYHRGKDRILTPSEEKVFNKAMHSPSPVKGNKAQRLTWNLCKLNFITQNADTCPDEVIDTLMSKKDIPEYINIQPYKKK